MKEKVCSKCKLMLPINNFAKDSREKSGLKSSCKKCKHDYDKKYKLENPEKYYATKNDWYKRNKEIVSEKRKKYNNTEIGKEKNKIRWANNREKQLPIKKERYERNKKTILSQMKEYREKNKEVIANRKKKYYEKNKTSIIKKVTDWMKKNYEKTRSYGHARRAREKGSYVRYTTKEWTDLCDRYNNKCIACGKSGKLQVDHIVPISKGGTNTIDNLQPLCKSCNCSKGVKYIDYRSATE